MSQPETLERKFEDVNRPAESGLTDHHLDASGTASEEITKRALAFLDAIERVMGSTIVPRPVKELVNEGKTLVLLLLQQGQVLEEENRNLKAKSITDELTGLYNRHGLAKILKEEIIGKIRRPPGSKYSAVMLDLDGFKLINDTFGHPLGNKFLTAFSSILRKAMRSTDKLFRYGGDEFLVLIDEEDQHETSTSDQHPDEQSDAMSADRVLQRVQEGLREYWPVFKAEIEKNVLSPLWHILKGVIEQRVGSDMDDNSWQNLQSEIRNLQLESASFEEWEKIRKILESGVQTTLSVESWTKTRRDLEFILKKYEQLEKLHRVGFSAGKKTITKDSLPDEIDEFDEKKLLGWLDHDIVDHADQAMYAQKKGKKKSGPAVETNLQKLRALAAGALRKIGL